MKHIKYIKQVSKDQIEELIKKGLNRKDIAITLNIPNRRLYDLFEYYNIKMNSKGASIMKNDKFFDNIDSEIKAYLLGFLVADGSILIEPKKKNGKIYAYNKRIAFCNSIDDLEIIELFHKYICPDNSISFSNNQIGVKKRKIQCRLKWSSPYMVDKLIEYGINKRKTYDITFTFDFSILRTDEMIIHFLRGFFDGDGWVSKTTDKRWKNEYTYTKVGFVGTSKSFLFQIIKFYKKYDLNFKIHEYMGKNMKYYQILLHGKEAIEKFRDIMYGNATFFLNRKFNKFKE